MLTVSLGADKLDSLMPMHLIVASDGRVRSAGRALRRLSGTERLAGCLLDDIVEIERPARPSRVEDLAGPRLSMRLSVGQGTSLRGHGVRVDGGDVLMDLTIAVGDLQALGGSGLTAADFAPTDSTLDMLYLMEAKTLAMAETHRLIGRLQTAKSIAESEATTDPLTGLVNRRGFDEVLHRAVRERTPFALAHVDLDHFKAVNDGFGHPAGDAVLIEVGKRLREIVRASDTVARVGGDEFTIVLHRLVDRDVISGIARRIVCELEKPVHFDGTACRVSASIGIAISQGGDVSDPEKLIADADGALYRSKAAGRARHSFTEVQTMN